MAKQKYARFDIRFSALLPVDEYGKPDVLEALGPGLQKLSREGSKPLGFKFSRSRWFRVSRRVDV